MSEYAKPALELSDQLALLESRGLIIGDKVAAANFLSCVSYYRMAGYWWPLQQDQNAHIFKPGTTFELAVTIYNFDRKLRKLLFHQIEHIEVSLRTKLIYHMSLAHGPNWYENEKLFHNGKRLDQFLDALKKELENCKEPFMVDHRNRYGVSKLPPSWKALEIASFGQVSRLVGNIDQANPSIKHITRHYRLFVPRFLKSWLEVLVVLRNMCAHHSRVWNRRFTTKPDLLKEGVPGWLTHLPPKQDHDKLYVILCCLQYLLRADKINSHLPLALKDLLAEYPEIDPAAMGFPAGWQQEPLWQ